MLKIHQGQYHGVFDARKYNQIEKVLGVFHEANLSDEMK